MKKFIVKIGYQTIGFDNAKDAFQVWELCSKGVVIEQDYNLNYQSYEERTLKPSLSVEDNVVTKEQIEIMRKKQELENAEERTPE